MTDETSDIETIATRTERLLVKLTDEEKLLLAARAAAIELDIEEKEGERKDAMRETREALDSLKGQRRELARAVVVGAETRDVQVRIDADYNHCVARTIRCDTGEVIADRVLTADELQGEVFRDRVKNVVDALFDEALGAQRQGAVPAPVLTVTVDLLDGKASDVATEISSLQGADDLRFLREWETQGKARKTVLGAIEERWIELGGDDELGSIELGQTPPPVE